MNRLQQRRAAARERELVWQVRDALRVRASILGLNPKRRGAAVSIRNPQSQIRNGKAVRP